MEINHNVAGWFEIPALDIERAIKFYESVFGFKMQRERMGGRDMAWFPWVNEGYGTCGSLVYYPEFYKPSANGTLIYLTAFSGDVENELSKIEPNGGKILEKKNQISSEHGYMTVFLDTEGNRIALHSKA